MTTQNSFDRLSTRSRSNLWRAIKWTNRHGTSTALLLLLVGACVRAHLLAVGKTHSLGGLVTSMDSLSLRRVAGIGFIHSHWWFVLPYLTIFGGSLIWLEARSAPRWAVWAVFIIMAVPCLGYMWTCLLWAFTGLLVTR